MDIVPLCRCFSCFCCRITHCHPPPKQTNKQTKKHFFFLPPHLYPTSVELLKQAFYTKNTKEDSLISSIVLLLQLKDRTGNSCTQCKHLIFWPISRPLYCMLDYKRGRFGWGMTKSTGVLCLSRMLKNLTQGVITNLAE